MAIAYDNSSQANSLTVAHTIAGPNDRLLVAAYHGSSSSQTGCQMASCTYNGVAAAAKLFASTVMKWSNWYGITYFYWLESQLPATGGTYNIVATPNSGVWNYAGIGASFTGVEQAAPEANANTTQDVDQTSITQSITSLTDGAVTVSAAGTFGGAIMTITPGNGQTKLQQANQNAQGSMALAYKILAAAGAHDEDWDFAATAYTSQLGSAIFAPAGGTPPAPKGDFMMGMNF